MNATIGSTANAAMGNSSNNERLFARPRWAHAEVR